MKPEELSRRICELALDKLGEDIVEMDLRGHSALADFFVVVTAGSTIHSQAIAKELVDVLRSEGERAFHVEGVDNGQWVLLDYVDVVVHIFLREVREFYGLERLWGDLPQREIQPSNADS